MSMRTWWIDPSECVDDDPYLLIAHREKPEGFNPRLIHTIAISDILPLIEALKFYATARNWTYSTYDVCQTITPDDLEIVPGHSGFGRKTKTGYVYESGGKKAREALAGLPVELLNTIRESKGEK